MYKSLSINALVAAALIGIAVENAWSDQATSNVPAVPATHDSCTRKRLSAGLVSTATVADAHTGVWPAAVFLPAVRAIPGRPDHAS